MSVENKKIQGTICKIGLIGKYDSNHHFIILNEDKQKSYCLFSTEELFASCIGNTVTIDEVNNTFINNTLKTSKLESFL